MKGVSMDEVVAETAGYYDLGSKVDGLAAQPDIRAVWLVPSR
jgi:hypothetical protein